MPEIVNLSTLKRHPGIRHMCQSEPVRRQREKCKYLDIKSKILCMEPKGVQPCVFRGILPKRWR